MVSAVRRGASVRSVAERFGVGLATVTLWVQRCSGRRLDRCDFSDHPSGPGRPSNRTSSRVELRILHLRRQLKVSSDLGEYGAAAIRRALCQAGDLPAPSLRTVGRVLERHEVLSKRRRRFAAPPPGWYLPELHLGRAELDSFDIVEGLVIQGGVNVEVLNAVSLFGGLASSWPNPKIDTEVCLPSLVARWRQFGLPNFAQFDNDTVFQGPHQWPNAIGRIIRLCLQLGVVPVFAPPRESGFQAAIENFNSRWQQAVWHRFRHAHLTGLRRRSNRFVAALNAKNASRIDSAPPRRNFPANWQLNLRLPPRGQIVYLRRTDDSGHLSLLGHRFQVDRNWCGRLVRCQVLFDKHLISFFALRRRLPHQQPLLKQIPYHFPNHALEG